MIKKDEIIKGIEECDLNGGWYGNCPYKEILILLKEKDIENSKLKQQLHIAMNVLKEQDLLSYYRILVKDKLSSMYGIRED